MASQKTSTIVKIGKDSIPLRYNFASADALDQLGINIYEPSSYNSFSPSKMVSLVWAGQLHTKAPLSRDQIAKSLKLSMETYAETARAVAAAIGEAITQTSDQQ